MAKNLLDKSLKERFEQVYWSINLYNSSLTELLIISNYVYNDSELQIINSHTFDFYRVTLQYCFIMEYNKLLEKGNNDKNQHISSLRKLNEAIYSSVGKSYEANYLENEVKLSNLKSTYFHEKIKKLRDKKFAHADNHDINIPYKIMGLNSEELNEGFLHLQTIKEILDSSTTVYDFEYSILIPNNDNRTENFIRYHAEYKDHYYQNFKSLNRRK